MSSSMMRQARRDADIVAAHRRYGTTGLLPTLISDTPQKMRIALEAVQNLPQNSGVLGIHFEGPFLSPEKPGVHDASKLRLPAADDLALLISPSAAVKLVTLAPEEVPKGFIADLVKAGVCVALGHSMATYAQTKAALAEGLPGSSSLQCHAAARRSRPRPDRCCFGVFSPGSG